jgi:hypothetical protein
MLGYDFYFLGDSHMTVFKSNAEAAVFYASQGWPVFPCYWMHNGFCTCGKECKHPGKHPMPKNGHLSATTNLEMVRAWWESAPDANIGIAMGGDSGVWVFDIDGPQGIKDFAELEKKNGPVVKGPCVKTGGGGMHLYFGMPTDRDIRDRVGIQDKKLDVRGTGGYVIAPPSNHVSGRSYEWERSPNDFPIPEAPAWLIDFVTSDKVSVPGNSPDRQFEDIAGVLNLATDPGAPEGKRHDMATRLIGAHLCRKEDTLSVYFMALAWGKRCQPPMDDKEILRIVTDLYKKDAGKLIDEPANDAPWPILAPAALHGLAGEIVSAIEPHTEADNVAILVQLLTFFGCVIGRNPYFTTEETRHGCNLFAVLVGETGSAKKGTSADRVKRLFRGVDDAWSKDKVIGGLSSGEGLIIPVQDTTMKKELVKDGAAIPNYRQVIDQHGVTDKRLLIIESEFSSVFAMIAREGNVLSQMIREAWDSGNLRRLTKINPLRATNAHISIIGHITPEELLKRMAEVEAFNGFANRILWLCVRRSKFLPNGGGVLDLAPLIARLIDVVQFATTVGQVTRDAAASAMWDPLYRRLGSRRLGGALAAVTNRAEAQVLRLSMIYALLDMKAVIEPKHIEAALAVWQYAEDSARYIFGNSTGDSLADRLLAIIREKPVTMKDIHNLTGNNLPAGKLHAALNKLVRLKLIRRAQEKTAGRPADRWYPAE